MPLHGPAYEPEKAEVHEVVGPRELRNGWRYEASDFGNGYLLYPPGSDQPMADTRGHVLLYYTIHHMTAYTFEYERRNESKAG